MVAMATMARYSFNQSVFSQDPGVQQLTSLLTRSTILQRHPGLQLIGS